MIPVMFHVKHCSHRRYSSSENRLYELTAARFSRHIRFNSSLRSDSATALSAGYADAAYCSAGADLRCETYACSLPHLFIRSIPKGIFALPDRLHKGSILQLHYNSGRPLHQEISGVFFRFLDEFRRLINVIHQLRSSRQLTFAVKDPLFPG